jgi:hypothetical protein
MAPLQVIPHAMTRRLDAGRVAPKGDDPAAA